VIVYNPGMVEAVPLTVTEVVSVGDENAKPLGALFSVHVNETWASERGSPETLNPALTVLPGATMEPGQLATISGPSCA
jgi:hypothetical protein